MKPAQRFEDLLVWQKSHQLVLRVYRITAAFPSVEMFGLSSQMRRAAVSVAANIAEGFKRRGNPDKARVLNIAQGSLEELRYYFLLSKDLDYVNTSDEHASAEEIGRMLHAYISTVRLGRS